MKFFLGYRVWENEIGIQCCNYGFCLHQRRLSLLPFLHGLSPEKTSWHEFLCSSTAVWRFNVMCCSNSFQPKGKGKVHPRAVHEGLDGE
jgi:hypothetical protein